MATESDSLLTRSGEDDLSPRRKWPISRWSVLVLFGVVVILAYSEGGHHLPLSTTSANVVNSLDLVEGGLHHTQQRYKATQFISFTINTLGGLAEHGECEDLSVDGNGVCYLGNTNITEDLEHRLLLLRGVLEKLKEDIHRKHPDIDHRDDVLKIFAMPEFYFRGPWGAYTTEQLFGVDFRNGLLLELGDRVHEYIKDEVFSNYLFIFGTIIAVGPRNPATGETITNHGQTLDPEKLAYANFSPIAKGGPNNRVHSYLATKRYISTVDFLNREILPNPRNYNDSFYKHDDFSDAFNALLKERKTQLVQDNVIDLDGLKIGVEICLDHRMGSLWENLKQHHKSKLVDVQIITSAGMAIERGPNPVVPGGVVYLSDGEASSAACYRSDDGKFDPDEVCRSVGPKGRKHLPQGGHKYSEFFSLSACLDLMDHSDVLEGYYSIYATQGCANTLKQYGIHVMHEFDYYPPSIEIYPTVDLPENTYHRTWA